MKENIFTSLHENEAVMSSGRWNAHITGVHRIFLLALFLSVFVLAVGEPFSDAFAKPAGCSGQCSSDIENGLKQAAASCTAGAGVYMIQGIFNAVNQIMNQMAQRFFDGVISNQAYKSAVDSVVLLYITVYGIMIMFNIASHRTGEIVARLFKIGLVWSIMTGGWGFFSHWIGDPLINALNELITQFSAAGGASSNCPTPNAIFGSGGTASNMALDYTVMNPLMGPMTLMFSLTFVVLVLSLVATGPSGWFIALAMVWGMIQFLWVVIGALITYIRSIVGLSFLFGLAPIFFVFILFEKTHQVFKGWVNQVFGFFLQPVLLFAFLGFFGVLINNTLMSILFAEDTCWVKFFPMVIFDIYYWRPDCHEGDWQGVYGVAIMDCLYFLLLTHLGKNLGDFIERIAHDISGGMGPGVVRGATIGQWMSNKAPLLSSVSKGRGYMGTLGQLGKGLAKGGVGVGKGVGGFIGRRMGLGKGSGSSGGNNNSPGGSPRTPSGGKGGSSTGSYSGGGDSTPT
jgi:hypothetical protein